MSSVRIVEPQGQLLQVLEGQLPPQVPVTPTVPLMTSGGTNSVPADTAADTNSTVHKTKINPIISPALSNYLLLPVPGDGDCCLLDTCYARFGVSGDDIFVSLLLYVYDQLGYRIC